MKAIVLTTPGGVENLSIVDLNPPEPSAGEVRVAVNAIGINPVDVKLKYAAEPLAGLIGKSENVILGWDIAGVVDAVGEGVTTFAAGDRVFGMVNFPGNGKAYAEYVAAPADQLAVIPEGVGFEAAAAACLAALTALQALTGRVREGSKVLIHAGSGGVGHFAVQIAKTLGAHVTSTSSGKNRDFVLGLGADRHIDYREEDFAEVVSDMDFVFDTVGPEIAERSVGVVKPGGTLLSIAMMGAEERVRALAEGAGVTVETMMVQSNGADMARIADMIGRGVLKPAIFATYPFDRMGDAHSEVEKGRSVGKVVVTV